MVLAEPATALGVMVTGEYSAVPVLSPTGKIIAAVAPVLNVFRNSPVPKSTSATTNEPAVTAPGIEAGAKVRLLVPKNSNPLVSVSPVAAFRVNGVPRFTSPEVVLFIIRRPRLGFAPV